ncbi:MAG TPA: hypothetical protein VGH53_11985 [Streptosporangiaceae bacterium]
MRPAPGVRLLAAEQALPPGPHLTKDSHAHPTISALTDPVLASSPGRSAVLGGWLLTGWYLVSG